MEKYKLIGPIKQLLSMDGLPLKGALKDEELPIIENAGILTIGERIHTIGNYNEMQQIAKSLDAKVIQLQSDYVCLPGFIDAHTHICFSGSRANDYAMRNSGKSYLEIAKAGGGIWDTVTNTRTASQEELCHSVIKRANHLLKNGITTVEVKSGYGLSIQEELKMLRAIKGANENLESDLIPTCLAAHMLPKDYNGTHEEYLNDITTNLFPNLITEKLTNRIDAFVEQSAFSKENIKPYFNKAIEMGFDITVHADQFTTSGSEIAVEINAVSADHLEASTDIEIKMLAESDVVSVALPGASIGLGCDFTPARKILDAGGALAIASDWNPGSAPMGDLLTQACILGTFEKLSNTEVLAGITTRAAAALKLDDRGKLAPKMIADFCFFSTDNYNEILYHQGKLTPNQVWKRGDLVYSK
ncbi:imidazolonepropionase [Aquimarina sp. MMG015]|uniref:imidazolonepropionase n=1 Tax=unclassified Aquimarina TaxID=2627091 RepID=UPI000E52530B|nr:MULTISPECIES: imidazolonepropionase [unclassified Aquimarina]AXT55489.1 imidazolonepropionase [Aquimarina sp. AD1]MBQ4802468.1 imidazolonepropionase [Aquimarina sp. MMG015]RKN35997.1 imidazolonepropionase [Aquimarina sp. AD1]